MATPRHTALPKLSVVIPARNALRWLPGALASVGPRPDIEVIVVDDASTDGTADVIARYAARDTRIRPHRNATNSKLPKSLNAGFAQPGLAVTEYQWIQIKGSDDELADSSFDHSFGASNLRMVSRRTVLQGCKQGRSC